MHVEKYLKRFRPRKEGENIWFSIGKTKLKGVLKEMKSMGVKRISFITGVDTGKDIEVIYHLIHKNKTINVRVSVDKKKPEVETITDIYPGANLFERELAEMLGVKVKGHPNLKNLFLDKDSPKAPYRKS